MAATLEHGTRVFNQGKHDRFVAQQVKSMTRLRSKGHRDWVSSTDEQIKEAAMVLARCYNAGEEFEWSNIG